MTVIRSRLAGRLAAILLTVSAALGLSVVNAPPAAAYLSGCHAWIVHPAGWNWGVKGGCTGGSGHFQVFAYCVSHLNGTYLASSAVGTGPNTYEVAVCDTFTYAIATYWITDWN